MKLLIVSLVENDPFFQRTAEVSEMQVDPENYKPVPVDQELLLSMNYEEVLKNCKLIL
jgi:hypothetical protein